MLSLLLLVAAIVVFILAAINLPVGAGRVNLIAVGLALWAGSQLAARMGS